MGKLNDETLPPVTWPKVMNHHGALKKELCYNNVVM